MKIKNFECKDLKQFTSSMLYDRETIVATGEFEINGKNIEVFLMVDGDVNVDFKGETYRNPSEFPDELIDRIRRDPYHWDVTSPSGEPDEDNGTDVHVESKNWFSYVACEDKRFIDDLVEDRDISKLNPDDIMATMKEVIKFALA